MTGNKKNTQLLTLKNKRAKKESFSYGQVSLALGGFLRLAICLGFDRFSVQ